MTSIRNRLINALLHLPNIMQVAVRDQLLYDLPPTLQANIPRSDIPRVDLGNIITAAEKWNDSALNQILNNAIALAAGGEIAHTLEALQKEYAWSITGESPPPIGAPRPPEPWAERPEFASVRAALLAGGSVALSAEGRGGIGKTALAAKLAWDLEIRAAYPDGVVWISLGPQPDVLGALAAIATVFHVDVSRNSDAATRAAAVQAVLATRHCLLIVDDVWAGAVAQLFGDLAPTAILLTTRDHSIARDFAPRNDTALAQLTPSASVELLQDLAPAAREAPELPRVAALAAGLPLTLRLLAPLLDDEARMGWGLDDFLHRAEDPAWRGQLLDAIVSRSLDALPPDDRAAFVQLAVFGAQPETFELSATVAVWAVDEATARARLLRLVARNLLDPAGGGRFSLHQSLADVAVAHRAADDPAPQRHAAYYLALIQRDPEDWRSIGVELPQIRRAWEEVAGNYNQMVAFVSAMLWFHFTQGLWHEALSWAQRGLQTGQALGQHHSDSVLLIRIAKAYNSMHAWRQSLEYLEKVLPLLEAADDKAGQAGTLLDFGWVYYQLGDFQRSLKCYEQALALWAAIGDQPGQARTLRNIGSVYYDLEKYQEALSYYERAQMLQEEINDQFDQAGSLYNIGLVYDVLKRPDQALIYLTRALHMREDVGDLPGQARTLDAIGEVYFSLEGWEQVLDYCGQALSLAEALGDRLTQSSALGNIGKAYQKQGDLINAERLLSQAVAINEELGSRHLEGNRALLQQIRSQLASTSSDPPLSDPPSS